jgi:hypothetical protein
MIERAGRIEDLAQKTTNLTVTSARFKRKAEDVHSVMWWKNKKYILVILIVVLVRPVISTLNCQIVLTLIIIMACGGPTMPMCKPTDKPPVAPEPTQ